MKKFIIIPTYNEKQNLPKLAEAIFGLKIPDLNIIVVDDNSPDGTGQAAEELAKKYPMEVIHRAGKMGLGSAYVAGFKRAIRADADAVFEMDADFSHNPKDIPRLLEEIEHGYEVVIGSRRIKGGQVKGWSWRRDGQSRAAMAFARFMLKLKTRDITAGFRCILASALNKIDLDEIKSNGYAFQEEMIYKLEKQGCKIKEVPVTFMDRKQGRSKLGIKDIAEFFATVFRLRFSG